MIKKIFQQFTFFYAVKFSLLEILRRVFNPNSFLTYSQTGEDIIIRTILEETKNGFYIEIGSNEPIQHSNTFALYQSGWTGITIDANQKMVDMHKSVRPNDIALCAAVSDIEKEVIFYEFDMDEISTIDNDFYDKHRDIQSISKQTKLTTRTLNSILDEYLPVGKSIDLMSIDVEGHDYHVLKSINLDKYRPRLMIIEIHDFDLLNPTDSHIYTWLMNNNYKMIGYATWNGYFIANQ